MADHGMVELELGGSVPGTPASGFVRIYPTATTVIAKFSSGATVDLGGVTGITASGVANVPAGNIVSTDVQAAINELDAEKAPITHVGSTGISEHGIATGADAGFMSPSDFTKLAGIATGATANSTDAYLLARANHTGFQVAATISDFATESATQFGINFATKTTSDLTESGNLYFTDARARTAVVDDAIADGMTTKAPSQNAVFDALALKQPLDATLTALAAFNSNGYIVQTAADTFTARTFTGSDGIVATNGSGVAGATDFALDITGRTALDASANRIATNDEFILYDASATSNKKITLKDFVAQTRMVCADLAYQVSDDFVLGSPGGLTSTGAGTGNSDQVGTYGQDTTENAIGIAEIDTGTTAAGRRSLVSSLSALMSTLARYRFAARYALNQLSDGTNTFTQYIGFVDNSGAGDMNNGAYFRYTNGVNSGRWEAVTAKAGTRTATNTGITADILYSVFEIEISQDGANAYFYINGTIVATNTTNIPIATAAQTYGYGWKLEKSLGAGVVATSADWYVFEVERSTAR